MGLRSKRGGKMIKQLESSSGSKLKDFIAQDNARNYFIRLGLESDKDVFKSVYVELDGSEQYQAALFHRASGNLQFYAKDSFEVSGFASIIKNLEFGCLIGPASFCDKFIDKDLFESIKDGAILAALTDRKRQYDFESFPEVTSLRIGDLEEVETLYKEVFESFSPLDVMKEKLKSGRGRGVLIREGNQILAVAQSEFESPKSALIVGVATRPGYERRGLATMCLEVLCKELMQEGKNLFLQYDNIDAGRIYERLGFMAFDRVRHYRSR